MRCLSILATIMLASSPAAADYTEIAPVRPLTMIDPAGLSFIGLDFQFTKWTEQPVPNVDVDFTSLTFNIAADLKIAPHWVLLARVPLSKASVDGDPLLEDCCDLALGNLTIGG